MSGCFRCGDKNSAVIIPSVVALLMLDDSRAAWENLQFAVTSSQTKLLSRFY